MNEVTDTNFQCQKKNPTNATKNYIEMKGDDFQLNTWKVHSKKPKENFQQLFLSDCFVLCLQKRAGNYHMQLSTPAYIFHPTPYSNPENEVHTAWNQTLFYCVLNSSLFTAASVHIHLIHVCHLWTKKTLKFHTLPLYEKSFACTIHYYLEFDFFFKIIYA